MDEAKTEALILSAARKVFVNKGKEGARMQEIADAAGVNKMLLHYYFRNKETLFHRVVEDIVAQLFSSVVKISVQAGTFHEFLWTFIDRHIDFIHDNMDMLYFLLWEVRKDKNIITDIILKKFAAMGGTPFDYLTEKIDAAVAAGEIRPAAPADVALNLVSLDVLPLMVFPFISSVAGFDQGRVRDMIQTRKQEAFRLLWNDMKLQQGEAL